ncbi:MAG: amino acid carrier protein, partial [Oscillospiraceae bacterium]|nr:amino acid carrier protein [Oscillospiraceae bacterium]
MLAFVLGCGVYLTWRTGGIQLFRAREVFRVTAGGFFGRKKHAGGPNITPFQAVSTALAGTMGVGNITGIAAAVTLGGPGAVFWMWVSAFFGMATKYAEILLSVYFRRTGRDGRHFGGPMYYIEEGLRCRPLAALFCILCAAASLGIGNMSQTNAIAVTARDTAGIPPWVTGAAVTLLAGAVLFGGVARVARAAELLIPALSILYLSAALAVILLNVSRVPQALCLIFSSAFGAPSLLGGAAGYSLSQALRCGVSRGILSNEAGLG